MKELLLAILIVTASVMRAQDPRYVDSLRSLLDSTRIDTVQMMILVDLQSALIGTEAQVPVTEQLGRVTEELLRSDDRRIRQKTLEARFRYHSWAAMHALDRQNQRGALTHYNAARKNAEERADSYGLIQVKEGMAWLYLQVGDSTSSRRLYSESLHLALALGDSNNAVYIWPYTFPDHMDRHGLDSIVDFMDDYARGKPPYMRMDLLFRKGLMLHDKGFYQEALQVFRQCEGVTTVPQQQDYMVAYYWCWLGSTYQRLDSISMAVASFGSCMTEASARKTWSWYCACSDSLGLIHAADGHVADAERRWLASLNTAQQYGYTDEVAFTTQHLKELYERQGRAAEALTMTNLWITVKDSLARSDAQKEVLVLQFHEEQRLDSLTNVRDRERERLLAEQKLGRERARRNVFLFSGICALIFAGVFFRQRNRIGHEKRRSEELLLNILPAEVAEELKDTGAAQAKHFDGATILFTDFKGFTSVSEQLSPQELVEELNTCFKAFDDIITARGIEKIKTIGDAYMCAGGLPDPSSSSPADVVHAGMDMQAFMIARKRERDAAGLPAFEMRVGIHTGPVVAGIVGLKKFQYDIWGDTVNTASRMESSGAVGQVNISEATYLLVKDEPGLTFTPRGKVQAKGKGEMEMYFVEAPRG